MCRLCKLKCGLIESMLAVTLRFIKFMLAVTLGFIKLMQAVILRFYSFTLVETIDTARFLSSKTAVIDNQLLAKTVCLCKLSTRKDL